MLASRYDAALADAGSRRGGDSRKRRWPGARSAAFGLGALAVAVVLAGRPAAADPAPSRSDLADFLWPGADTRLMDQDGQILAAGSLDDKVVAVTFFDTRCSAPCALRTLDLAAVARSLNAEDRSHLALLVISVDAAEDDTAALAGFAAAMKLDTAAVTLLTGGPEAAQQRMRSIRFHAAPGAADAVPSTVFVFDRRGQMAMRYAGDPVDSRRLKADLATLTHLDRGVGTPAASSPSIVAVQ